MSKRLINRALSVLGVQVVRTANLQRLCAAEAELRALSPAAADAAATGPIAAAGPVAAARQVLGEVEANRLYAGAALYAAFKDIRTAAQITAATSSAAWLYRHAARAPTYARRVEMIEALIPLIPPHGDLVEFGVYTGSVTWFLRPRFPSRRYHAFDSWRGVPEAMSLAVAKHAFDLDGKIPGLPKDTTIHAGWFRDTIPEWLRRFDAPVAFAYIDCDLYESVCTVLDGLSGRVRPGTILAFDDWYNFPNWQAHSYRAAREWTARHGLRLEPLGFATMEHAGAFRVAG